MRDDMKIIEIIRSGSNHAPRKPAWRGGQFPVWAQALMRPAYQLDHGLAHRGSVSASFSRPGNRRPGSGPYGGGRSPTGSHRHWGRQPPPRSRCCSSARLRSRGCQSPRSRPCRGRPTASARPGRAARFAHACFASRPSLNAMMRPTTWIPRSCNSRTASSRGLDARVGADLEGSRDTPVQFSVRALAGPCRR